MGIKIVLAMSLIVLAGVLSVPFGVQRVEGAARDISLFGHFSQGWGFTSTGMTTPGPTITVDQGDLVSLTLTSVDGITHNFFVDYDGNTNPSVGEPKSPDFTGTTSYEFTAATVGTFTYYCQYHKIVMRGTFIVTPLLDTSPPSIEMLSPQNTIYSVNAGALVFVLNESASWMGYSLDGQLNVTITGNATLFSLLEGPHNVIVYANDTSGNMGSSNRVYFSIQPSSVDISPPSILILSPENKTYAVVDVPLLFELDEPASWMAYSLDGGTNETIAGSSTLSGLSEGPHKVMVYANDTAGNMGSSNSVYFSMDVSAPTIQVISPENRTYSTSSVSLSFVVDEATSLIWYSLDGQANVSIAGNATLSNLPAGSHNLIVYAVDLAGNTGASRILYFAIGISAVQPSPTEVVVVIVVAAVIVVGVVAYFVRFRSKKKPSEHHEGLIRLVSAR